MKKLALLMIICILLPAMPVFANENTSNRKLIQYLQHSLTPDEYGGIYFEESKFHIKPLAISHDKVLQTVEKEKRQ